jgi:hypothetical protein
VENHTGSISILAALTIFGPTKYISMVSWHLLALQPFSLPIGFALSNSKNEKGKVVSTFEKKPIIWKRYVDNILFIWPGNERTIEEFHDHLNTQDEDIKFTME